MNANFSPQLVKTLFSAGSYVAPSITGNLAFWLFCYPRAAELSKDQTRLAEYGRSKLAEAIKFHVSFEQITLQAYHFSNKNPKGTILLVHGWTSEASHMMALVDPLLKSGYDVVCFDLPGHGKSSGRVTNLVECAKALQAVASRFANIHGIVAHSFGGPVTALALAGIPGDRTRFDVDRIALIASPNESAYVTQTFCDALGLSQQAKCNFETTFETLCDCDLGDFTGSKYFSRINRPLLVLHSTDDVEIPYEHGLHYRDLPQCQFVSLDHVGHREILHSSAVGENVARFMAS
jgi:pimeloyl-ACP methyl ester carboxylesterase